ncbi:MAG: 6-phosphogluconolactonase, partial [Clostridia bacterium]|nr:6-phosphogluconolactonase [Clostridia bacterium]
MEIRICKNSEELGKSAAKHVAQVLKDCIAEKGSARIVLSTGASQFDTIKALVEEPGIKWECVEMFHLDEYVDLPITHVASFRKYLQERFVDKVGKLKAVHFVDGTKECIAKLTEEIRKSPIDIGLIGIGENGHIAFNDPPADFDTKEAYIIVNLDDRCKKQQMGEGWFATIDDVPKQAVSMTCYQIMQCERIVSCVPYKVKAEAVENTLKSKDTTNII